MQVEEIRDMERALESAETIPWIRNFLMALKMKSGVVPVLPGPFPFVVVADVYADCPPLPALCLVKRLVAEGTFAARALGLEPVEGNRTTAEWEEEARAVRTDVFREGRAPSALRPDEVLMWEMDALHNVFSFLERWAELPPLSRPATPLPPGPVATETPAWPPPNNAVPEGRAVSPAAVSTTCPTATPSTAPSGRETDTAALSVPTDPPETLELDEPPTPPLPAHQFLNSDAALVARRSITGAWFDPFMILSRRRKTVRRC
jgi:hypothetical protein